MSKKTESERFTKVTTGLLLGVKDLVNWGFDTGNTTPEMMRLTIAARQEAAVKLIEGGMSQRQVARVLGVSHTTVQADVADNLPKSGKKSAIGNGKNGFPQVAGPEGACCGFEELHRLVAEGIKFGNIYVDPPWLYDNQATRAATGNHYKGLTIDQLCDPELMPVAKLGARDVHLHLWTTNGFLFECPRIFKAWEFEFKSSFVWVKSEIGLGNYWRNSHEILLTAVRGNAEHFDVHDLRSWIECSRGNHSDKPDQVRTFIERASPTPRIELFARREHDGWLSWGDQIDKTLFSKRRIREGL